MRTTINTDALVRYVARVTGYPDSMVAAVFRVLLETRLASYLDAPPAVEITAKAHYTPQQPYPRTDPQWAAIEETMREAGLDNKPGPYVWNDSPYHPMEDQ